jgi:hypothetical protein
MAPNVSHTHKDSKIQCVDRFRKTYAHVCIILSTNDQCILSGALPHLLSYKLLQYIYSSYLYIYSSYLQKISSIAARCLTY